MILDGIFLSLALEGSHWDVIKGDLHNLGELGSSTAARNKYVRRTLAKHGKKATEEELDELASKRGKHGVAGILAGGLAGGLAGSILGGMSGGPIGARFGAAHGSTIGGAAGSILARARANRKFIHKKVHGSKSED